MKRLWFYLSQPFILLIIVVLALLLVGAISYPSLMAMLNSTPMATSTPTATPTSSTTTQVITETPSATLSPTSANTPDVEATQTALAGLVAEGVFGTQTAEARKWTPTPTVTLRPTWTTTSTRAPTLTATPLPTSASPASLASSATFVYAAPTDLVVSSAGDNNFSFNWNWNGSLKVNEFFELRIWSGDGPHWGGAEPTKDLATTVDMHILARGQISPPKSGEWLWEVRNPLRTDLQDATSFCAGVAVITKEPYTSLSPESNAVCWNWP